MKILLTGMAGFIGFHLAKNLASKGHEILGIDNLNSYYDVNLKISRLKVLGVDSEFSKDREIHSDKFPNLSFIKADICDRDILNAVFGRFNPELVIHLAAQAGVRYSLDNPDAYIDTNLIGYYNILKNCKESGVKKFLYASSSSVYGNNLVAPFNESMNVDKPVSLYAATKKANELIAYTYSHLYDIKTVGLRFFTVYGPFGRPDMAYFSFANKIFNDEPINVYNNGNLSRDFTYIDDIVNSIDLLIQSLMSKNSLLGNYEIFNIGNSDPVNLMHFIRIIESSIGKKAILNNIEMQDGDVFETHADNSYLYSKIEYKTKWKLQDGIKEFINWYKHHYGI